jgi:hypothetical protein
VSNDDSIQRWWCSGNINAFQAFALGSIPGQRKSFFCITLFCDIVFKRHVFLASSGGACKVHTILYLQPMPVRRNTCPSCGQMWCASSRHVMLESRLETGWWISKCIDYMVTDLKPACVHRRLCSCSGIMAHGTQHHRSHVFDNANNGTIMVLPLPQPPNQSILLSPCVICSIRSLFMSFPQVPVV